MKEKGRDYYLGRADERLATVSARVFLATLICSLPLSVFFGDRVFALALAEFRAGIVILPWFYRFDGEPPAVSGEHRSRRERLLASIEALQASLEAVRDGQGLPPAGAAPERPCRRARAVDLLVARLRFEIMTRS